ncbi:MAG TPA: biotin/lipoyl-binding protein, partial [Sphingomonas sp.]
MADEDQDLTTDAQTTPGKKRLSRRARLVPLILLAIALVCVAIWFVHYETRGKYVESTNDAFIQSDAVTVSPRISGYVEQVYVGDNQNVKAGAPLVRIDPRDYRAQAAQYRAQIDVAEANADNVRAMIHEQDAAITQARAQLSSARTVARFDAGEVDRYAPLAASGAETREKLASLRNQAAQSAAAAAAQSAALQSAERRIGALTAQVRQAQAQGETAQAQMAAA